jgi:hypothetical protein
VKRKWDKRREEGEAVRGGCEEEGAMETGKGK